MGEETVLFRCFRNEANCRRRIDLWFYRDTGYLSSIVRKGGTKVRRRGKGVTPHSRGRGYTDADTSRASGGSSRAIETRISLTLRGRGWRGAEGWWPPFFTSSSILVPCKYCNFFLPFVTRLFSIRRARKRKVVELG